MYLVKERSETLLESKSSSNYIEDIISFPLGNMDTSWMTKAQKKIFQVLQDPANREKTYLEIISLAGYKNDWSWYRALKDERYVNLLESIGVETRLKNKPYPPHSEVEFIKNPEQRQSYLENDLWDMRKLFEEYPRQPAASEFIVDFRKIQNQFIRNQVKRYFKNMLSNWKPATYKWALGKIMYFFKTMQELFPEVNSLLDLTREEHIEKIVFNMNCSNDAKKECLTLMRSMFKYISDNRWDKNSSIDNLIISHDIPRGNVTLPRPIEPHVKRQMDEYIEHTIVPLLEEDKVTPLIQPQYWDMIIVIRYTGRRYEDIVHLLADNSGEDCLRYDADGDPQLYIDHRIGKIPKDLIIPLAHLNDVTSYGNIVERAIKRQKQRVRNLPPAPDGYKYLFREIKFDNRGQGQGKKLIDKEGKDIVEVIPYIKFQKRILPNICKGIPLIDGDGAIYNITPHQFRHTAATEMIDAGIDIYAVKEFLGHSSVAMTEQYIKVYQGRLKKEFKEKLMKSEAADIKENLPEPQELYDNKWVKNKILAVFELGDGCCEHPYKIPSCPHMACKTCIKKKIYPRHLQAVKETIECETVHRDNAVKMGLYEKAEEFDKVVKFYTIALEKITKGEIFDAAKDFYK
ncbi:tyrosine-type recombinase/integrase [Desnuesiella massiliensis]|uniref:tyrosine-type recombinase/integrase n=1 Tax=Desnuesiella massiliensis TaxID=1650662 RepID=UPI0006E43392|nr:site-specific integrase [Desnuesiella massiliensis]